MTSVFFNELIKKNSDEYYLNLNRIREEYILHNRKFKNGDIVSIKFRSPEYGVERADCYIKYAKLANDINNTIVYGFGKLIKKNKKGKRHLILPKRAFVMEINLLKK